MSKSAYAVSASLKHGGVLLLDHILNTEKDTLRFRLLAMVIAAVSLYFSEEDVEDIDVIPAVTLSLVYLFYTLLLSRVILPRIAPRLILERLTNYLIVVMILADSLLLIALLYFVGGPENVALILIPLFIVYHSIYLGYFSGLISATLFSLFFVTGFAYLWGETDFVSSYVSLEVPFFYLLAIVSGYMSERRLRDRWEKDKLQRLLHLHSGTEGMEVDDEMEPDLDTVIDEVITSTTHITGLSYCLIALLGEESPNLIVKAGNIDPAQLNLNNLEELVFDPQEGIATIQALRTGQSVVVVDTIGEEQKLPGWAQWLGVRVMVVVSLVASERNWGAMYLFSIDEVPPISREKLNVVRGYATLVAETLARDRLRRA